MDRIEADRSRASAKPSLSLPTTPRSIWIRVAPARRWLSPNRCLSHQKHPS